MFKSLLEQLNIIYSFDDENDKEEVGNDTTWKELKKIFFKKLETIDETVFILLDSIDQLTSEEFNLNYFIYELPQNLRLIYSVSNDYKPEIVEKIGKNYLEIKNLGIQDSKATVENLLKESNRQLTSTQWKVINNLLERTPELYPLHLKLLFDIASKWMSSYLASEEFNECTSAKETIKYLFKRLERHYGEILFSRCIFYLTLFEFRGVSENEMEDILSIDDDVLDSIFKQNHPRVRRFPINFWLMIKYELKEYLAEKQADGVTVVFWFHKAFIEASQEYYSTLFQKSETKDKILMNVINYFTEKWNKEKGQMKEFSFCNKILNNFDKNLTNGNYMAYRNTKPQEMRVNCENGGIIYNHRKLNEFVNVIKMLQDKEKKIELLKDHVYFDHEFMVAKAELHEMSFVTNMHANVVMDLQDQELLDISEIYCDQFPFIENDPKLLTTKVLSRLKSRSRYARKLAVPSNLLALHSYIKPDPIVKEINFENIKIKSCYILDNTPYLFLKFVNENLSNCLRLINFETQQDLGTVEFNYRNLQVIMYEDKKNNLDTLAQLNGKIFYVPFSGPFLYSTSFKNKILIEKEFENNEFIDDRIKILPLNENIFAIFFKNKICIFEMKQNKLNLQQELFEYDEIKYIKTTIPDSKVFSHSYLNKLSFIIIIVVMQREIKVYQFSKSTGRVSLISKLDHDIKWDEWKNWDFFERDITCKEVSKSIIIDECFLIDNTEIFERENEVLIRFIVVERDKVFKVVEVKKKFREFEIIEKKADRKKLDVEDYDSDCSIPMSFFKKKLIVWLINKNSVNKCDPDGFLMIYDFGE